jgi:ADP-heptose:LPS heptosyltransferase
MYFILDKNEGRLIDSNSKKSFYSALVELGISERVSIKYSTHNEFWGKFSSFYKYDDENYFANCKSNFAFSKQKQEIRH